MQGLGSWIWIRQVEQKLSLLSAKLSGSFKRFLFCTDETKTFGEWGGFYLFKFYFYLFLHSVCVCVFVKPERLRHCEVVLTPKTRNLRTNQSLT